MFAHKGSLKAAIRSDRGDRGERQEISKQGEEGYISLSIYLPYLGYHGSWDEVRGSSVVWVSLLVIGYWVC